MLQVKTELKDDLRDARRPTVKTAEPLPDQGEIDGNETKSVTSPSRRPSLITNQSIDVRDLQTRAPAIIGDATFRGTVSIDGAVNGQAGSGGSLSVRQRGRPISTSEPELVGDIFFKDMLRINGHVAGTVSSKRGTLIVDLAAIVDAHVDVAIAVIAGTVNGDVVGHQRVELAPTAKINGNIWTKSLAIQGGAIFEGVCQMLENDDVGH